jgi:outer membrane lipoprotein-sorting protein
VPSTDAAASRRAASAILFMALSLALGVKTACAETATRIQAASAMASHRAAAQDFAGI